MAEPTPQERHAAAVAKVRAAAERVRDPEIYVRSDGTRWKLVSEDGPELVNFGSPSRVHIDAVEAEKMQKWMSEGRVARLAREIQRKWDEGDGDV